MQAAIGAACILPGYRPAFGYANQAPVIRPVLRYSSRVVVNKANTVPNPQQHLQHVQPALRCGQ